LNEGNKKKEGVANRIFSQKEIREEWGLINVEK
jgi:hypothetical protein